jgi:hypothetical protein
VRSTVVSAQNVNALTVPVKLGVDKALTCSLPGKTFSGGIQTKAITLKEMLMAMNYLQYLNANVIH